MLTRNHISSYNLLSVTEISSKYSPTPANFHTGNPQVSKLQITACPLNTTQ